MRILTYKKSVILALVVTSTFVAAGVLGWDVRSVWKSSAPIAEVKLRDFTPGTQIDYRIISGNDVVAHKKDIIKKDGILSLKLDEAMLKDKAEKIVKYELNMRGPTNNTAEAASAEMLRVLLNLDKSSGDVSVSASGLEEYSDVILKNKTNEKKLSADWAGLFSADVKSSIDTPYGKDDVAMKLAFQNTGIHRDIESLNPGEIEVFFGLFGDSSGSNLNEVQRRWSWALIRMTEELSAVMSLQTMIVGMFFDASIQLETQRKHQELMARAHKDYHPSEQMCRIGTFVRSVAHTESKAEVQKHFLNKMLIEEYTGVEHTIASAGVNVFESAKMNDYITNYCDTEDNDAATTAMCNVVTGATTAADLERQNKDIDYTRTLATKLTLDVDYTDAAITPEEADIVALSKQLYFPSSFEVGSQEDLERDPRSHYSSRSYAAKMAVAHNSFINIVGMKSSAPAGVATTATTGAPPPPAFGQVPPPVVRPAVATLTEDSGWAYMKAMMIEFGLVAADIDKILGERPSYYAQMEVMTKKIYQDPNFYTNLYDKPANVKRIGASLDAISLMHQRDRFESLLRREMLTAVMVEEELKDHVEEVNANMYEAMQRSQIVE